MMEYFFRTEQMTTGYDGQPVIRDITFGLKKGEILTLIGPNGAGKSTILRSIAGQLEKTCGAVYLGGRSMEQMTREERSRNMSILLTQRLRGEWMTCRDVVATGRYPYTGHFGILTAKDREVVDEAMDLVHITEIGEKDFLRISDGQRQRVMLARAICQEPEIILLDEPTSYLDIRYKLEFLSALQDLRQKKKLTVILSLHELELAEKISDKILCVKDGRADRFGTPEEVCAGTYFSELFCVTAGSFDEKNGTMELEPPDGAAEVFVIPGRGQARPVYRRLQRQGIPFVTGILYVNDLDHPVAMALATEVIEAEAFEPMTEEQWERARERMDHCKKVICCRHTFGTLEQWNKRLLDYAIESGKEVEIG